MKILMAMGTLALVSGLALGSSITGGTGFVGLPGDFNGANAGLNSGTPYWDNHSNDGAGSNTGNVGFCLEGTAPCNNDNPVSVGGTLTYLNGAGSGGTNNAPSSFSLSLAGTNSLIMSIIGVHTTDTNQTFGIYNASLSGAAATASEIPLFGPGAISVGSASPNEGGVAFPTTIGFYINKGCCTNTTWFSNTALNTQGGAAAGDTAGHQHFVIFNSSLDPNSWYLGVEDWINPAVPNEFNGDYNDLIIKINANNVGGVPEPATFALMGAGLLGLGYARFRSRKDRP